eukprot:TRINITY_DN28369_c0_g1_i1.p2 TRINITY_DN28369_c0_g1~~TRINITY_DN28369_c0_g1_i1.p2  ORF type:complete len:117 (-),score=18.84 TRINITY_DN28369_c0_g1_i1:105-455(-)
MASLSVDSWVSINGRVGRIVRHDPDDNLHTFKVAFSDNNGPGADWFAAHHVVECECTSESALTSSATSKSDHSGEGGKKRPRLRSLRAVAKSTRMLSLSLCKAQTLWNSSLNSHVV